MTAKIKILHLTYHMGIGGTEQVIYQLVTHSDKNLFENSVACIEGEVGAIGQKLKESGTGFYVFNRSPGFDKNLIRTVRQLLTEKKIDIVHCHQYTPYVYGVLAALFSNTKVVFTEHGRFHPDRYSWKRRLINPFLGFTTAAITTISEATKDALSHFEWFRKNQIRVVYNGIQAPKNPQAGNANIPELNSENLVFGTITRFDSIKNLPMMINAFSTMHAENPSTRLLLVGDGEEKNAIEELVDRLNLKNAVIFTGFQTDTNTYMSLIDVYVLSSFSEGTSMTLLEAMSLSKSCIVTAVGGNIELIQHQENGLIVESDNSDQLATAMRRLLDDQQLRTQLGIAAKQTFNEKFSVDQMIHQYKDIYLECTK